MAGSVKTKLIVHKKAAYARFLNVLKIRNSVWHLDIGVLHSAEMAELAMIHEFGTSNIPARPFIRSFFRDRKKEVRERTKEIQKQWALFSVDPTVLINALGEDLATMMRERMIDYPYEIKPPLAASTVYRKELEGHLHPEAPLVRTGDLMESIDYKVTKKRK